MNYLEKYKESPYLLTEDEVKAKPLGDILELVKHIDQDVSDKIKALNIHQKNGEMLHAYMVKICEGVSNGRS